jgi:hypothetical protein
MTREQERYIREHYGPEFLKRFRKQMKESKERIQRLNQTGPFSPLSQMRKAISELPDRIRAHGLGVRWEVA